MAGGRGGRLGNSGLLVRRERGPRKARQEAGHSFLLALPSPKIASQARQQRHSCEAVCRGGHGEVRAGNRSAHPDSESKHLATSAQVSVPNLRHSDRETQPQVLGLKKPSRRPVSSCKCRLVSRRSSALSKDGGGGWGRRGTWEWGLRGSLSV